MNRISAALVIATALGLTLAPPCFADPFAESGRAVMQRHALSLWQVKVQLRQTITMGEQSGTQEANTTSIGLLVDAGNLIAVSLSILDPGRFVRATNPQAANVQIESEVSDIKVQLPSGGELAATVVYRDKDLDLAFLATREPLPKDAVPVRLDQAGAAQPLDLVLMLGRSANLGRDIVFADAGRVQVVLAKPQHLYVLDKAVPQNMGTPVFTQDGKLLGMILMNFTATAQPGAKETLSATAFVVPTATIREAALQAEAARKKAAADKPATEKAPAETRKPSATDAPKPAPAP